MLCTLKNQKKIREKNKFSYFSSLKKKLYTTFVCNFFFSLSFFLSFFISYVCFSFFLFFLCFNQEKF